MQLKLKPFQSIGKHAQIGCIVNYALLTILQQFTRERLTGLLIARDRRYMFGGALKAQDMKQNKKKQINE